MSQQFGPPQGQGPTGPGPYGQQPPVGPPPAAQPPMGPGRWAPQPGPQGPGGPPQGPGPQGPGPQGPGGWGPQGPQGPQGPFGMPPGHQFNRPKKSNLPRLLAIIGGALAVLLIIGGATLLVTGRDDEEVATPPTTTATPTDQPSGSPTEGSTETPSPTSTRTPMRGEVEVGRGVYFVPAAGWQRDTKARAGANYLLPHPTSKGKILGWFWARQTELRNAKDFAQHLVDVESNNLHHVVIRQGRNIPCPRPSLKTCYAINYSAVVQPATPGKKPVVFRGLIQAFERQDGLVTATDAAIVDSAFKTRYPDIQRMIATMFNSF